MNLIFLYHGFFFFFTSFFNKENLLLFVISISHPGANTKKMNKCYYFS